MYLNRTIEKTIKELSSQFPVIVVLGARQVGKSTLLQMIKNDNMKYIGEKENFSDMYSLKDVKEGNVFIVKKDYH